MLRWLRSGAVGFVYHGEWIGRGLFGFRGGGGGRWKGSSWDRGEWGKGRVWSRLRLRPEGGGGSKRLSTHFHQTHNKIAPWLLRRAVCERNYTWVSRLQHGYEVIEDSQYEIFQTT